MRLRKRIKPFKNPEAMFLETLARRVEAGEIVGILGLYINGQCQASSFCMGDFSIEQIREATKKVAADMEEMIEQREMFSEVLSKGVLS